MTAPSLHPVPDRSRLTDLILFRNRWWQHLLFWTAAAFILLNIFKTSSTFEKIDLIYTLIFLGPLAAVVYVNLYLAVPRLLGREKYLVFTGTFLVLLSAGALFLYFLFERWIDLLLPGYYFISYYSIGELMIFTGSIMGLTTLLKLSRSWFLLLRIEKVTTTEQLHSLQSQINPHFLLNGLQTIYGLSLANSERTPRVILQLADILRYTLYESRNPGVSLQKELEMIGDYVEIYRNRIDPERAEIRLVIEPEPDTIPEEVKIAPMLLIPYIENSFKHGPGTAGGRSFVRTTIRYADPVLHFSVENSSDEPERPEAPLQEGIGLKNTRRRLQLLYPEKHRLQIRREKGSFRVDLEIRLNQGP